MVDLSDLFSSIYGHVVNTPEADSIDELIDDCTAIPAGLRTGHQELPLPRAAAAWSVSDECLAQVTGLDEYV